METAAASESPSLRPPLVRSGLPIVGPLGEFQKDPLGFLERARARYGDVFTLDMLLYRTTFVVGPEAHREFFRAGEDSLSFDDAVNQFSQTAVGRIDEWGRLSDTEHGNAMIRKGLMHHPSLDGYVRSVVAEVEQTLDEWTRRDAVDLFPAASRLVTNANIRTLMGERIRRDFGRELGDAYFAIEEYGTRPESMAFPRLPSPAVRKARAARKRVADIVSAIAQDPAYREPGTYLDQWMTSTFPVDGRPPEPFELAVHFIALLFAAHTNTTGTFAWLVAEAARRPDLLARLRAEQDEFRARNGEGFTFQALRQLPLLDATMREVVRTHFTLMLVRKAVRDFRLGRYTIPRGDIVAISPIVVHRDPKVYDAPDEFRPERWLDPDARRELVKSGAYVQFGAGEHRCLGELYANLVLKIGWSVLLRRFDVELLDRELPPPDWTKALGTAFAAGPVRIRLRRR